MQKQQSTVDGKIISCQPIRVIRLFELCSCLPDMLIAW